MHIAPHDNQNKPIVDVNNEVVPLNYFNIVKLTKGGTFECSGLRDLRRARHRLRQC